MKTVAIAIALLGLAACDGGKKAPVTADAPDVAIDAPIDAPEVAPVFRNPVTLPDDELATQALQIIGADVPDAQPSECNTCHGLTRTSIRKWGGLTTTALTNCFTDLAVMTPESARTMLDCMRTMPAVPTSDFETQKMGVFAAAARLPWFEFTFKKAYGATDGATALADFRESAGMPRGATVTPLTQEQFDIIAEWFVRGTPFLDNTLAPEGQGTTCTAGISPDVGTYVTAMKTTGWRAVNRDGMMAMYGCGTETDPRNCLADHPLGSDQPYGTGWDVPDRGHARILKDVTYRSFYWTRSSPDGRFIAHGVETVPGSYILDLERDVTITVANTQYDPAFFPNEGGGFVFQGATHTPFNNVCRLSVLTSLTGTQSDVSMAEAGCARANMVGLYQHVGRALDGGDYFAIDSEFTNDNGGHTVTRNDPDAAFDVDGRVDFTPMIANGTNFTQHTLTRIKIPYEGDVVMSPSSNLIMSRVAGDNDVQLGYVLRKVDKVWNGSTYTLTPSKIGRYCVNGAKVNFSFDERFVTYHHYVTSADFAEYGFASASDPGFADYLAEGAADIYVMDLVTGIAKRVTHMNPGQYALFPHFRSDGWIYADVRDRNLDHEYFIAHDAALILEQ